MSGDEWADHFSTGSVSYRRHRPRYPRALFEWLAATSPARDAAWDCGTGNGQAAVALGDFFTRVFATDRSASQLAAADRHPHVEYRAARAESSGLEGSSVDLVTVAQALHWFDLARFYDEVRRVLRRGGLIAIWCYGLMEIEPDVDRVVRAFYTEVVGPCWPPERRHIETGYRDLELPFPAVPAPPFTMTARWTLADLTGYVATWSATEIFRQQRGRDAMGELAAPLAAAWGDPGAARTVVWPLVVRAGRR